MLLLTSLLLFARSHFRLHKLSLPPAPCARVHRHNVDALLSAALPYHATNEFVRLVQILRLEGGLFEFLVPMQVSGAALPRAVLVQRCLTDRVSRAGLLWGDRHA